LPVAGLITSAAAEPGAAISQQILNRLILQVTERIVFIGLAQTIRKDTQAARSQHLHQQGSTRARQAGHHDEPLPHRRQRLLGARGGKAFGRNQRLRRALLPTPPTATVSLPAVLLQTTAADVQAALFF